MEQAIYENWLDKQPIPGLPAECFRMEDSQPGYSRRPTGTAPRN